MFFFFPVFVWGQSIVPKPVLTLNDHNDWPSLKYNMAINATGTHVMYGSVANEYPGNARVHLHTIKNGQEKTFDNVCCI